MKKSRREFLKSAALTMGAAALPASILKPDYSAPSVIMKKRNESEWWINFHPDKIKEPKDLPGVAIEGDAYFVDVNNGTLYVCAENKWMIVEDTPESFYG